MKVRIDIDTNTFVRFWLVVIGFALALLFIWVSRSALITILLALFLALALNPPVSRLASVMPGRSRVGATAIAYVIVITVLGVFLFTVIPPVIEQSVKFAQSVPQVIDEASSQRKYVDNFIDRYGLNDEIDSAVQNAKDQAAGVARNLGNILVTSVSVILNGAATLFLILVLAFLMLIEGPKWLERIWGLYTDPDRLEHHRTLVHKMYRVVTGYVNGQLIVAGIAGVASGIVVLVLSFVFGFTPGIAVPLAAIVFISGLIPLIGATLGAIVVTLVLLFNNFTAAIVFLVYFIVYQQVENNFISPTVQSKTVELSALAVIMAILIGGTIGGLLGVLVAIPIAGIIRVLAVDYLSHAGRARKDKSGPVSRLVTKIKSASATE